MLFHAISFGGYATPTKCGAFWRWVLNVYKDLEVCHVYNRTGSGNV